MMGVRDLTLFLIVTVVGLRWIAVAAAAGPSSLVVWLGAAALLFVPLVVCVLELGRRYPDEGGLYAWVKRAFGEYPAFITGWTYWASNLPYFPGLLYFAAANALLVLPGGGGLSDSAPHVAGLALVGLLIAVVPNLLGIGRGKWVQNVGALAYWAPATLLVALGVWAFTVYGSATPITARNVIPELSFSHALAWSTIALAFGGVEAASLVATQVRDPQRTIPRAVMIAGTAILLIYVCGTLALLWALPQAEISQLGGIAEAMQRLGERAGASGLGSATAALLAVGAVGGVGAWLTAVARLPYVAGIDRYLPRKFGSLHPRYGTPYVAMLTQAGIAAILIVVGQAGTTVRGAYAVLVAMTVISYFIPMLFIFAAAFRLAHAEHVSTAYVVGPRALRAFAALGFVVLTGAMLLAFVPDASEANPVLSIAKLIALTAVLLLAGSAVYVRARLRSAVTPNG
jgi:amino acid transporter